jgi:hypothetical protein
MGRRRRRSAIKKPLHLDIYMISGPRFPIALQWRWNPARRKKIRKPRAHLERPRRQPFKTKDFAVKLQHYIRLKSFIYPNRVACCYFWGRPMFPPSPPFGTPPMIRVVFAPVDCNLNRRRGLSDFAERPRQSPNT